MRLLRIFTLVLLLSLLHSSVRAAEPLDYVTESRWATSFGDFDGNAIVPTRIEIKGAFGTFYPYGRVATLAGIMYIPSSSSSSTTVTGFWSYAGETGWFSFDVLPGSTCFYGIWGHGYNRFAKPTGFWQGVRLNALQSNK